jgi:parallel beta-helix repeat protein
MLLVLLVGISYSIDVSGCRVISSAGTYDLVSDLQGANVSSPEYVAASVSCLRVTGNNVIIDCHGHAITENATGTYRYGINTVANLTTIRNCIVSGYNGSGGAGITIIQNSSLSVSRQIISPKVDNVTSFSNYYGLFTYNYDSGSAYYGTRNLTLSNSTFYQNQYGVYMSSYATNFSIIGNNISFNNQSGIYTTNLGARNVRIINNTASFNRGNTSGSGGFYLDGMNYNVTILNNTAEGNGYYGIYYRSLNTTVGNNIIIGNGGHGMYADPFFSGPSYYIIQNNTARRNNLSGLIQTGYQEAGSSFNFQNNTAANNGQDGIILYGYIFGSVLGNTAENNSVAGIRYTSYFGGDGGLAMNAVFNGNRVYNNTEGFSIYTGASPPSNITFQNNTALENTRFDYYMTAYGIGTAPYCDVIRLGNMTSSGGRSIVLLNASGDIRDLNVAELVLCDADNSTVSNVTIHGSDLIHNNGILLHMTDNTTFENLSMSDDYASFDMIQSHWNRFRNINVTGSTLGVMNYHYFTSCCPTFHSSENNTFSSMNFAGCGTAYYFDFNSLGSNNVSGGLVRDSTGPGMVINTSLVFVNGTRLCNNNPDMRVWADAGFAAYIGLTMSNAIFDSPSCSLSNFTNLSLTDTGSTANYTINWSSQPAAAPPAGRFPFKGFLNFTKITSTTIDRMVFNWRDDELAGSSESLFRLYRYDTVWTSVNSSPNTAANTLSLSSVSTFSVFGILASDSPPTVTLLAPPSWSLIMSGSQNLTFNTSDNSPALNCTLYVDSVANMTNASVVTGTPANFSLNGISDGWHSWYVRCLDSAGNLGTSATRYFGVDTTPPTVDLLSPADYSPLGSGDVNFTYYPEDYFTSTFNCSLYLDGNLTANDPSANGETGFMFYTPGIPDGVHEWYVECNDGTYTNESATWHFTVDTTPPAVALISPENSAILYAPDANLTFNATDNVASVMGCSLYMNATLNQTNSSVQSGASTQFGLAGLPLGAYSWFVVCDDGLNNGTSDSWDFTVAQLSSGDEDEPEPPLSISVESTCEGNTLAITSRGDAVRGAEISIDGQAAGSTADDGTLKLADGCGKSIRIDAEKSGYRDASGIRALVDCGTCNVEPPPPPITCQCGFVFEGKCVDYACCSNSSCLDSEYCDIPKGQSGGVCRPVTGECGEIKNHTFVRYGYQCGYEPGCQLCQAGYRCEGHACVTNDLKGPDKVVVGQNGTVAAIENGAPCAYCDVEITSPGGAIFTGKTDAGGTIVFPFRSQGEYRVSLLRNGYAVKTITIQAFPLATPAEPEKPAQTSPQAGFPWWLIILLLIIIALIVYWRRRKTGKNAAPAPGKKAAPAKEKPA